MSARLGPCTVDEKVAADRVLAHGIEWCESTINKYHELPRDQRNDWWYSTVKFWKNARKGFQMLRGQNRRRKLVLPDEDESNEQE